MNALTNRSLIRPVNPQRRHLLQAMTAMAAGLTLGSGVWQQALAAGLTPVASVPIVQFDKHGKRLGEVSLLRVVKSEQQWRAQLSPLAFEVTRQNGTERAFSGDYNKPDVAGIFCCICCDTALFDAATEFHSGTGWPSFWQPIAPQNVVETIDTSFFMQRTAVSCARCNAHLGHVFKDGPPPTGLRYCMNSVALRFVLSV